MFSKPEAKTRPQQWLRQISSDSLKRISSLGDYRVHDFRYLKRNPSPSLFSRKDLLGDQVCNKYPINFTSDNLCALCRATFSLRTFSHLSESGALFKHHDGSQLAYCAAHGCKFCELLNCTIRLSQRGSLDMRIILTWTGLGDFGQLGIYSDHPAQATTRFFRVYSRSGQVSSLSKRKTMPIVERESPFLFPRGPNLDDSNEIAAKQMRSWLSTCLNYHRRCGAKGLPILPTRVINVEKMCLSIPKSGETGQYSALSYCWGGPQLFRTDSVTLGAMKKHISYSSMPKTLQDAVFVTKQLGLRYLWIDSLCILQDDPSDMAREINSMHLIYKNATVVIGAEVPAKVDDGFLHPRVEEGMVTVPFAISKDTIDDICVVPEIGDPSLKEALATRAWAFQETVLTSRLLIFSRRGINWSCISHYSTQDNVDLNIQESLRKQTHTHRQACAGQSRGPEIRLSAQDKDLWLKWQALLKDYIPLELTFAADKLPALAGIAQVFQPMIRSRYVAGMWIKDLTSQLGWSRPLYETSAQSRGYLAPSWSWASVTGQILLPSIYQPYETRTEAIIIACFTEPLHREAPYAGVKSGFLEIDAYLLTIDRVPEPWFSTTIMDSNALQFDGDDEDGNLYCMVLGYQIHSRWEGLFLRDLGDGTFQRVGFFRLGPMKFETREQEINHPAQVNAERRHLVIV